VLTTGHEDSPPYSDDATLPVPSLPPKSPTPRSRRTLWAYAVIAALLVVALFGLGAMALSLLGGAPTTVRHPTPTVTATATANAQATATLPSFSVPNAVIKFDGGGQLQGTQTCDGIQPLDGLSLSLDNAHSTISVDWWVSVTDKMPDHKHVWASAGPPYGTLRAGESTGVTLTPDPALCGELQGKPGPVTYHATVFYAGIGGLTLTDTITPPPGGPLPTVTGTIGPGPHP
jgi:hypothetical protein